MQQSPEYGPYRRCRVVAEHRLEQLGIRQARYFGRVKAKFQLYLAATVANLTQMANQTGVLGDPGEDDHRLAAGEPATSDHGVDRHLLPTWKLAGFAHVADAGANTPPNQGFPAYAQSNLHFGVSRPIGQLSIQNARR